MKKTKIILSLAFTLAVIGLSFYSLKSGRYKDTIRPAVKKIAMPVYNLFRDIEATPTSIHIKIKEKHFKKIKKIRDQALEDTYFVRDKGKYFPAKITVNDSVYNVKLRLKGDLVDHFDTDKWSYRIKVLGGKKILNMTSFSIQHPYTRNFIWEWVYHQAMKREGIIALDYKFINVSINDSDYGIFAMEEHFNDHMLAKNGRVAGPILKFDETEYWRLSAIEKENTAQNNLKDETYLSSKICCFNEGKKLADSLQNELFKTSRKMLESFRKRELTASQVFDESKMATYFAISALFSANHGLSWMNERFYYDQTTKTIEPIAFDGDCFFENKQLTLIQRLKLGQKKSSKFKSNFLCNMASDEVLINEYLDKLKKIATKDYIKDLFNDIQDQFNENSAIILYEFPRMDNSIDNLNSNVSYIDSILNSSDYMASIILKKI